jgi:hypothetical protein
VNYEAEIENINRFGFAREDLHKTSGFQVVGECEIELAKIFCETRFDFAR